MVIGGNKRDFLPGAFSTEYLKAGEEINGKYSPRYYTPLMAAVFQGHQELVETLLKYKADVNIRANNNITALWLATSSPTRYSELIITELLRERPDLDAVPIPESVLPSLGHRVVPTEWTGNTPLMQAVVQLKNPRIVSMLVDKGANVMIKNHENKTAKDLAAEQPNSVELLDALLPADKRQLDQLTTSTDFDTESGSSQPKREPKPGNNSSSEQVAGITVDDEAI
ncbi:hypothetical protein TWF730_004821 [Orbilia blumenaviensis]|uniref:Ankyrin repeat domain-containing protein n=1 Tax=Orbilia blumenaviensis TaxID=1796055 RepID=A0AAV9U016_9PEZI